ncbi:MAG TPA: aminotransferase class I/II-fold pyridoxal phosphate-dependent enzyme [Vicinamibacterales bacterium]
MERRSFIRLVGLNGLAVAATACAARGSRPAPASAPSTPIRLSSNENAHGPGERALAAVREALGSANRYAFGAAGELRHAVADANGVPADHVLPGCGSSQVLEAIVAASTGPDRALVTAVPTFELATGQARALGAPVIEVPVDSSLRLDLEGMAARAAGAGLIYVCNPNNPTGTLHDAAAIARFVDEVGRRAPDATVLVDEAYHEYVERPGHESAVAIARDNPRVIVVRTFSKIYGMAGLRVGYAIARPETLRPLSAYLDGLSLSVLSVNAALAALSDTERAAEQRALNSAARAFTADALRSAGCRVIESDANFVMVDVGRDVRFFAAACRRRGVEIARPFPPLLTHARITIGTMSDMQAAVPVFLDALKEPAPTTRLPAPPPYVPRSEGAWAC